MVVQPAANSLNSLNLKSLPSQSVPGSGLKRGMKANVEPRVCTVVIAATEKDVTRWLMSCSTVEMANSRAPKFVALANSPPPLEAAALRMSSSPYRPVPMPIVYVLTLLRPGKEGTILLLNIQLATSSRKFVSQVVAAELGTVFWRTPAAVISGPAPPESDGSRKSSPSCSPTPAAGFMPSSEQALAAWQGPTPAAVQAGVP